MGTNVVSTVHVSRYDATEQSVFGPLEKFDLKLSGTVDTTSDEFHLSGDIVGQPRLCIRITGKKVCDLLV